MVSMKEQKMSSPGVEAESSQCQGCKHCHETEFICSAFPFGIPDEVIDNDVIHDEVLPEQQGDYVWKEA